MTPARRGGGSRLRLSALLLLLAASWAWAAHPESLDAGERALGRGDLPAARREFESALRSAAGDPSARARASIGLANVELFLGEAARAAEHSRSAAADAASAEDDRLLGRARDALGNAFFLEGKHAAAIAEFREARRLALLAGDAYGAAVAIRDVGVTFKVSGRFDDGIRDLQIARQEFEALGRRDELASTVHNLGGGWLEIGFPEVALPLYEEAVRIAEAGASAEVVQGNEIRLGWLHLRTGDVERAETAFRRAASIGRERGVPGDPWTYIGLAECAVSRGAVDEAVAHRLVSLRGHDTAGSPVDAAEDRVALAALLREREPAAAEGHLDDAIRDLRGAEGRSTDWRAPSLLARALRSRGRLDDAVDSYREALARLAVARRHLPAGEPTDRFADRWHGLVVDAFDALAERSVRDGSAEDREEAFRVLDEERTRGLVAAPEGSGPLPLPRPAAGVAVVGWVPGRDRTWGFVLAGERLRFASLPLPRERLELRVRNFAELLAAERQRGTEDARWRPLSARLHADLVAPLLPLLPPGTRSLVVVAEGALAALPVEVLAPGGAEDRPLLVDFDVFYAPSARFVEAAAAPPPREADLLGFGAPIPDGSAPESPAEAALLRSSAASLGPLRFAAQELRSAGRHASRNSVVLLGKDATAEAVLRPPVRSCSILHFAAHGLVDEVNPSLSALLLSPSGSRSGLVDARELASFGVEADLVVLSACRTARGRTLRGQGVQGLARVFLRRGAGAVVASLWEVRDRETAHLMERFYAGLGAGRSASEALRQAKLELLRSGASPSAWAPFVLIGRGGLELPVRPARGWTNAIPRPAGIVLGAAASIAALVSLGAVLALRRRGD